MRGRATLLLLLLPRAAPVTVGPDTRPFVNGKQVLLDGGVHPWRGPSAEVTSPIRDERTGERTVIGELAQMGEDDAVKAVEAAAAAWNRGQGEWPQMPLAQRIERIQAVVEALKQRRDEIVNVLMWEICKNQPDAAAEFDRTMEFIAKTIETLRSLDEEGAGWRLVSGIMAFVRRAAIGVMLVLGPFNYPFNETYAALIPALLMGNVIVMKIPAIGGLAHVLTMEVYASLLPKGTINFISGSGRVTVPPVMRTGLVDVLGFIGGSQASDRVLREHPQPHRLKTFLQLDAKNLGVVAPDADVDAAVEQCVVGSTSYNGQRCTAIKLILAHESVAEEFVAKLGAAVGRLPAGLPWEEGVLITPLPEPRKPAYLAELVGDAQGKGARVVNPGGGALAGSLMTPAVVYPVTADMRLWHEEQFGPVVPVGVYSDVAELRAYVRASPFGQQAALFTQSAETAAPLIDMLSTAVGRVNLNTQCGRSPDELPFSGRRSSALGTMSVSEALRAFSTETVVAGKAKQEPNPRLAEELPARSAFMRAL